MKKIIYAGLCFMFLAGCQKESSSRLPFCQNENWSRLSICQQGNLPASACLPAQEENPPRLLDIKAYLNDTEIPGNVYASFMPIASASYVNLVNIFDLLASETIINGCLIEINGEQTGNIKITYNNKNNIIIEHNGSAIDRVITEGALIVANDEYYIMIGMVRILIDGAFKNRPFDRERVILVTRDYERPDIPLTLDDCYLALDSVLADSTKEIIRLSSPSWGAPNSLIRFHMGLGLWIRNNWIYPSKNRIAKQFIDNGITDPDEMSSRIILAYHYYLNGIDKTLIPSMTYLRRDHDAPDSELTNRVLQVIDSLRESDRLQH